MMEAGKDAAAAAEAGGSAEAGTAEEAGGIQAPRLNLQHPPAPAASLPPRQRSLPASPANGKSVRKLKL